MKSTNDFVLGFGRETNVSFVSEVVEDALMDRDIVAHRCSTTKPEIYRDNIVNVFLISGMPMQRLHFSV